MWRAVGYIYQLDIIALDGRLDNLASVLASCPFAGGWCDLLLGLRRWIGGVALGGRLGGQVKMATTAECSMYKRDIVDAFL